MIPNGWTTTASANPDTAPAKTYELAAFFSVMLLENGSADNNLLHLLY